MTINTAAAYRRRRTARPVWEERPTLAGQVVKAALLTGMVLAVLFPMWSIVVTSLSSRQTINDAGGMVVVPRDFIIVVASAIVICFVATIYPSRQAAKLDPVQALRFE